MMLVDVPWRNTPITSTKACKTLVNQNLITLLQIEVKMLNSQNNSRRNWSRQNGSRWSRSRRTAMLPLTQTCPTMFYMYQLYTVINLLRYAFPFYSSTEIWKLDSIYISQSSYSQDLCSASWRVWFWSNLQQRNSPLQSNYLYPVLHFSDYCANFVQQPFG